MIDFKGLNTEVIEIEKLHPNDYNPNRMPETEMSLLKQCIMKFGFLFPILVNWDEDLKKYRIIDGYHRYQSLLELKSEQACVINLNIPYHEAVQLTVLMNRIKGMHQVEEMGNLVVKLEDLGLEDAEVCQNLGMEPEEYLRLKQQLGIAHSFKNHEYSKSWTESNGNIPSSIS